eukprot:10983931-Alexandrium_andersonii.AAC.1
MRCWWFVVGGLFPPDVTRKKTASNGLTLTPSCLGSLKQLSAVSIAARRCQAFSCVFKRFSQK